MTVLFNPDMDRILIVEDDERRRSWFQQQFARYQRDETHEVSVATQWLSERDYSLIFLDHDLAEEHYFVEMADDGLTGYTVANWLAQHPDRQVAAQIIVHSLNYTGAQRMVACLRKAGRKAAHVPFPYLSWFF
jgi:CheY-like chemotaxis protein